MKKEFELVMYYQDAEADTIAEEKFRKALAGLEVGWPERVDAAIRERLERLDGTGAAEWQGEVAAQSEKLR